MTRTPLTLAIGLGCLIAVSACSSDQDADTAAVAADEAVEAPVAEAPVADTATAETAPAVVAADGLTADDLPAIEAGLAAENEVLAKVADEVAQGVDAERHTELAMSVSDDATAAGVSAAGMDAERYRQLKDEVFALLGAIEMRTTMRKQADEADTTGLDAATVAEMKSNAQAMIDSLPDPYAGMESGLADVLHERESSLMELRAQNIGLLFKIAQG